MKHIQLLQSQMIPLRNLKVNDGQIPGLPANPRTIDREHLAKLKESLKADPEMLALREILVYQHKGEYVIIGGNSRLIALQSLHVTEVPCKVIPDGTTPAQLRAYLIKDNTDFGSWVDELLTKDWNLIELTDFGMDDVERLDVGFDDSGDNGEEGTVVLSQINQQAVDEKKKENPEEDTQLNKEYKSQEYLNEGRSERSSIPDDREQVAKEVPEESADEQATMSTENSITALQGISKKKYKMEAVITFESEEVQGEYFDIIRELKECMPQYDTIGERVMDALRFWRVNHAKA